MNELIEQFLSYISVERGMANNTLSSYKRDLYRFADFLNEAITLGDTETEIYDNVRFEKLTDTELLAELRGRSRSAIGLQVKAATHHGLHIEGKDTRFLATVVFDI